MTSLNAEHHIHLYGCLSAEDLWNIGKRKYTKLTERLNWYAEEYHKAYDRRPDWRSYWEAEDGLQQLSHDFLFREKDPFPCFQAKFNLVIALCQITPQDTSIVEKVFLKLKDQGLSYAEARTIVPPYIQGEDRALYFKNMAQSLIQLENESQSFTPRLAISLPRESPGTLSVYRSLRQWMDENPRLAHVFSAVDLAFYEENDPPKNKKEFAKTVLKDNKTRQHKLALLYHVGESFNTLSAASSARWVWEVAQMGATRIGHAISLGIGSEELRGRSGQESLEERRDHLDWLLDNKKWLGEEGYDFAPESILVERQKIKQMKQQLTDQEFSNKRIAIFYDDTYLEDFQRLQKALLQNLRKSVNPIIECCPTSNQRIGMIQNFKNHPLKKFLEAGLKVCLSTDDPGIFDVTLESEVTLALKEIGISQEQLSQIAQQQTAFRSQELTRSSSAGFSNLTLL